MRKDWLSIAVVAALLIGAVLLGTQQGGEGVAAGERIAMPPLKSVSGAVATLPPGKLVLIDFWATWCEPCRAELPMLTQVAKRYAERGVTFVAVNLDEDDQDWAVGTFLKSLPNLAPYVLLGSSAHAEAFHISMMPTMVLLDGEGRVVRSKRGVMTEQELWGLLDSALQNGASSSPGGGMPSSSGAPPPPPP